MKKTKSDQIQPAETGDMILKKNAMIAQSSGALSLLQRKAFNSMLAYAYHELPDTDIQSHTMSVWRLTQLMGYNSHNYRRLKGVIEAIQSVIVQFNVLNKDKSETWHSMPLLSQASITIRQGGKRGDASSITYAFPPYLRQRLYRPKMFIKLSLRLSSRLKTSYGMALYEQCLDWLQFKQKWGQSPRMSVNQLRLILGVPESAYRAENAFGALNRSVIQKAVDDVNKNSAGLVVRCLQYRVDRRVEWIRFTVTMDGDALKNSPFPPPIDQAVDDERQLSLFPESNKIEDQFSGILHREFGLSLKKAISLVTTYPAEHISSCIDYLRDLNFEGVSNIPPYAIETIKGRFEDGQPQIKKTQETAKKQEQKRHDQARKKQLKIEAAEHKAAEEQQARTREKKRLIEQMKTTDPEAYKRLELYAKNALKGKSKSAASIRVQMVFSYDEFLEQGTNNA